ncbi:hypothetical protein ACF0H5_013726 [Mactra antiquata]
MDDVKQLVNSKISGKKVMVFSKTDCQYSTMAKEVFKLYLEDGTLKTEDFECWEIETSPQCSAIQDYLNDLTREGSVPRVFINGKCIGGGFETKAAHDNGTLKELLQA